ncbi:hypothetical protein [Flavobacterium aestivum]|uniref:hypothetical protein n=1 Tax=Flavobacterium aestivum TaxID=3003257 RepID=UPI0022866FD8|nr:hypothetical protein [Flavobacterium aestivum]
MPKTISLHQIEDLAKAECKDAILLQTNIKTELHIIQTEKETIIKFPFGNKFDIID